MATSEQKKKLLKAKIAVALHDELGRVPKKEEIDQVFLLSRVMYKAILGLHFQRRQQKKDGQLGDFLNVLTFSLTNEQLACYNANTKTSCNTVRFLQVFLLSLLYYAGMKPLILIDGSNFYFKLQDLHFIIFSTLIFHLSQNFLLEAVRWWSSANRWNHKNTRVM
jgi:hypothetical protein